MSNTVSTNELVAPVADPGFARGGANPQIGSAVLLFGNSCVENYMWIKEIGPTGGWSPVPLESATDMYTCKRSEIN